MVRTPTNRTLALVALLVFQTLSVAASEQIDALRANVVNYYTAADADRSAPLMEAALEALESNALEVTAVDFLLGDGSWSDIDYSEVPSGVWSPWEHFRRLIVMAKAYKTPGQNLQGDPELLGMIESSLSYLSTFYGPGESTPGNWWFWTIGPALDLGPTLVLLADDLDPGVLSTATKVLEARIGPRPGLTSDLTVLTGQNRVWSAMNHFMLAVLRDDAAKMEQVRTALFLELLPSQGDGLQQDMSFHQHGSQLYTGGYGGAYANQVSKYMLFSRGTAWRVSTTYSRHFFDYMVEGIAWTLYQNYFDVSVIGREVSYTTATGFNGFAALLQMSPVESSRQAEIRSAAAMMLRTWDGPLRTEHAALALSLGDDVPAWPSGLRVYPESDHVIHRRPGWLASVRMFSNRTLSGETVNDENRLGSRQSDGRLYLVVSGDEYFTRDVWPTIDWSRLSGITVEQRAGAADDSFGKGSTSFVGGVTNGTTGAAAMELAPVDSELTARKAWVFFDDSIVFLTSNVECLTSNSVETVVDQRPMRDNEPLVIDGIPFEGRSRGGEIRWAAGDGVGYFFPELTEVEVRQELRFGSWVSLARNNPQGSVSNQIRTLWIDHGSNVAGGSTEYVLVPNVSATEMEAWASAEPVTILRNDAVASAARDERTGAVGVTFWQPGSIAGISVDQPSVVFVSESGDLVTLSVADPSRTVTRVRVTLEERLKQVIGNATVRFEGRTSVVDIPVSAGRSSTIVLSRNFRSRPITR